MSNDIVIKEFRDFGKKMNIILICFLLNFFFSWLVIPGILLFIYSLLVLGDTKRANEQLNDKNLQKFRTYYITSVALSILTLIVLVIIAIPFVLDLVAYFISIDPASMTPEQLMALLPTLLPMFIPILIIGAIGLVLIFISFIIQMQAWDNLNAFFRLNSDLFPDILANDAIEGSKNLKTASLCLILSFLIITIFIGLIYQILGYMKLSRLKNLGISYSKPSAQPQTSPAAQKSSKDESRFCSECGVQVKESENFCNSCGAKL